MIGSWFAVVGRIGVFLGRLLFIVVGVLFIVFSVMALNAPKKETATVSGLITKISEDYDMVGSEYTYHVFVEFSVDGETYNGEYGSYHTGMKEGDEVEVVYNVSDPSDFYAPGTEALPYIFLGVGILVVLISLYTLVAPKFRV